MDFERVYPNQLLFVTKFLPKLTHQLLSLAMNRNLKKVKIMKIISEWPRDSRFRRKPYRGLAIAEVEVDASDIYIGYDHPPPTAPHRPPHTNAPERPLRLTKLSESRKLKLLASNERTHGSQSFARERQSWAEAVLERLHECIKIEESIVCVIQRLDGRIIVVDGTHRLLAIYYRDGDLRNLTFLITL